MLEYFTYKKLKKHQAEKKGKASAPTTPSVPAPVITAEDEHFLERIISAEGPPPPLPERPRHEELPEAGDSTGNAAQVVVHDKKDKGKGKENERPAVKTNRFSFLHRNGTKKHKKTGLTPDETIVTPNEATKEEDDINKILDDLNLSAVNNRAFSISKESQVLVQKFTVVLKDLINGVPTAYDDLVHLLDDSSGTLNKSYDSLPDFIKKLITQLPEKVKSNLAPELLAVAAEVQGLGKASAASSFSGAAKSFLKPTNLKELVTKPGAVVSMLKAIMNALKLRWPAFMGTNVLLSLALFVLLFVFWYCHKRGREVRLEKEAKVDSEGRIIELDDDPMLEGAARPEGSRRQTGSSRRSGEHRPSSSRRSTDRRSKERKRSSEHREKERR